jgi:hypothetical protein
VERRKDIAVATTIGNIFGIRPPAISIARRIDVRGA